MWLSPTLTAMGSRWGSLVVAAALLVACGTSEPQSSPTRAGRTRAPASSLLTALADEGASVLDRLFVGEGTVAGTFVAVAVRGDEAVAYVTDGATVGTWMTGIIEGDHVSVSSGENRIEGAISESGFTGELQVPACQLALADAGAADTLIVGRSGGSTATAIVLGGRTKGQVVFDPDRAEPVLAGGTSENGSSVEDAFRAMEREIETQVSAIRQSLGCDSGATLDEKTQEECDQLAAEVEAVVTALRRARDQAAKMDAKIKQLGTLPPREKAGSC